MAFTSGTATDYLDLLNRLKAFVTQDMLPANERWSVLRWVPGPPAELVLQGPGLAGTDQINVGILSEAGADYGNWKLRGFVGWNPAQTFDGQYNPSGTFYALLMASAMPYWIVANGRRIVMVAKTGTYYEMMHLGLFLPYATPGQYPYPAAGRRHLQRFDALEQFLHLPQSSAQVVRVFRGVLRADRGLDWCVGDVAEQLGQQYPRMPRRLLPAAAFHSRRVGRDGWLLLRSRLCECGGEHHQRRRRRSSGGAGRVPHRLQRLLGP
jgi:hypothetical protein